MLNKRKKGKLYILSAPAGTGKNTLVDMLLKEFPDAVESVSYTTRAPRANEKEGKHYFFVDEKTFLQMIKDKEFLEYAKLYDHYYGTSAKWVKDHLNQGKNVFLVIDTQGALKLKKEGVKAVYIFIQPPSFEELQRRLKLRQTEDEESIQKRLGWAVVEMERAKMYDYIIINDDLKKSYKKLKEIYLATK